MITQYYDAVILGTDLGPLAAAALLAKRGFRVLVLGQGHPPLDYAVGPFRLPRHPIAFSALDSPAGARIATELALRPSLRRVLDEEARSPLQVALPRHRLDLSADERRLDAELEREFAVVKRPGLEFLQRCRELSGALDTLFGTDRVWPPKTLFERRQAQRALAKLPREAEMSEAELLGDLPEEHAFRTAVRMPAWFASDVDPETLAPAALARLCHGLLQGPRLSSRGLQGLTDLLVARIEAQSGVVLADARAEHVTVQHARATGVVLAASGDEIGAGIVIAGIDVDALIRLMPDRRPFEELFERIGEPQPRYYRYTVNAVLRRAGVPEALQQDLYFTHAETAATPEDVHHVQRLPLDDEHELLSIGALFPARRVDHQPAYLDAARGRTIATLQPLLPFLHDHLVLLDSPHDGLEPHSPSGLDVSRGLQRRGPQTMPALYRFPVSSALDMCALPVRSPIRRLLMCNRQVVPALGAEGQLLTACSVARIASQLERRRIWFQRRSWTAMQV